MTDPGRPGSKAAVFVGASVSFVVAVNLVRIIRPALLLDPDRAWTLARSLLWIALLSATAAAGALAAAGFLMASRSWLAKVEPRPLGLGRSTLVLLWAGALSAGIFLRLVWIRSLPIPFLEDEVNLIGPALALTGQWRDFADSIRPMPYGVPNPHEMIGVLYLRLFRESLRLFGATVLGVRFLSFAGGALSLLTGTLLARALLPRGGAALAALVLAGLRWHLILSRFGWHSVLVVPLVDLATLLLITARRRGRSPAAAAAGALLGIAAHFYLSAWIAATALVAFCLWPPSSRNEAGTRARRLVSCAAGFLLTAAPLFLFREGRTHGYFERASRHSVLAELRYTKSLLPPFAVAADSLVAPWMLPDPEAWHDLPDRSRLGWIIGIPVAVAFARALLFPREELSGLLLLHAGAALAAAVAAGQAGHPNGFRFGYLTTLTAVAAGAGCLQLAGLPPPEGRRAFALAMIGLLAVSGAVGARDAILRWPEHRATFDSFSGEDTLVGRVAARWERYGAVRVAPRLGRSDATIDTVRRYQLGEDPPVGVTTSRRTRVFRVAAHGAEPANGERVVEQVRDDWGRNWALVLGRAAPSP